MIEFAKVRRLWLNRERWDRRSEPEASLYDHPRIISNKFCKWHLLQTFCRPTYCAASLKYHLNSSVYRSQTTSQRHSPPGYLFSLMKLFGFRQKSIRWVSFRVGSKLCVKQNFFATLKLWRYCNKVLFEFNSGVYSCIWKATFVAKNK